jgi:hypothetical protein
MSAVHKTILIPYDKYLRLIDKTPPTNCRDEPLSSSALKRPAVTEKNDALSNHENMNPSDIRSKKSSLKLPTDNGISSHKSRTQGPPGVQAKKRRVTKWISL